MSVMKKIYFGWYMVLAGSIMVVLTMGMRMGIGPFVDPIMTELGYSRTALSTVIAVGMIFYGIGMPIAAYFYAKFNAKGMLLFGLGILILSVLGTISFANYWLFMLNYGILMSIGLACLSNIALSPLISKWFIRQRGKALFYLSTGGMAGLAVMTPLSTFLIDSFGWKMTLVIISAMFSVLVIPMAFFIIKENAPDGADLIPGQKLANKINFDSGARITDVVKTLPFWQIVIGLFACGFGMNLLGSHGVPMLMSHGFDAKTAAFGIGLIGFVAIFGSLFLAQLADRFPRKNLLFIVYFVRGLGFIFLVLSTTSIQLFTVALCCGLVWSGSIAMSTASLGDYYGLKLLGPLNAWAFFIGHQIGAAFGTFFGGWIYETYNTYVVSFSIAGVLCIIASVVCFLLPKSFTIKVPATSVMKS